MTTIWDKFAKDRESRGSSFAWAHLQLNLAKNFSRLVPIPFQADRLTTTISDMEDRIKNERATQQADPNESLAAWLRGDVTLDKTQVQ